MRPLTLGALLAVLALAPGRASACASCACGDPTLTVMGRELPYAGRLRLSAELRYRGDRVGEPGLDAVQLHEGRLELGLSYAPHERVTLSLALPLVLRHLGYVNLGWDLGGGLGDLELRARVLVYRDRRLGPRHLLAAHGGARLPPGPPAAPTRGGVDLLPSTGSIDPIVGLSYLHLRGAWSIYSSLVLYVATLGSFGVQGPLSTRGTLSVQWQPRPWIALQGGADLRLDGRARVDGMVDEDSGGFVAYLSPGLVLSPRTDWLLYGIVRVPVLQALLGAHHEGVVAALGLARDL